MKENRFMSYTNKVVDRIGCDRKTSKKIREDLLDTLIMKSSETGEDDPYILMGDVDEVAEEFRESLNIKENCYNFSLYGRRMHYEYKSKINILGMPLVHVVNGRGIAKGIFAVGPIAIGMFALGILPIGIISFGVIAIGLLGSLGATALSPIFSLGGIAVSYYLSFGGIAIAKNFAFGGLAIADVAIGGVVKAIVGVYKQEGSGTFVYPYYYNNISEIMDRIKSLHPSMSDTLSEVIKAIIKAL